MFLFDLFFLLSFHFFHFTCLIFIFFFFLNRKKACVWERKWLEKKTKENAFVLSNQLNWTDCVGCVEVKNQWHVRERNRRFLISHQRLFEVFTILCSSTDFLFLFFFFVKYFIFLFFGQVNTVLCVDELIRKINPSTVNTHQINVVCEEEVQLILFDAISLYFMILFYISWAHFNLTPLK